MKLRHILLSSAFAVGVAAPVSADDLTVSGATTTALTTSAASNGTPGNITVSPGASVIVSPSNTSTATAAITVNSSNTLTNQGTISNKAGESGIGVNLVGGNTGSFSNLGTIDVPGTGTPPTSIAQFGVLVNGTGAFNGNITLGSTSIITVGGSSPEAIGIQTELNGNVTLDGKITTTGTGAAGLLTSAPIDGAFVNRATILVMGGGTSISTLNPQPGTAVGFGGSIGGGFLNVGPVSAADTTAAASITSSSSVATVKIAPELASNAASATIGIVSDTTNPGFSFINRGLIANDGVQPSVSTLTMQIGNSQGDTSGMTTLLPGGIFNAGTIRASATSDNAKADRAPTAASDASAIMIGVGGIVPNLTNGATGTITATTAGPLGGTATAVWVQSSGSLGSLTNAGKIIADSVATNPATTALTAYAVRDQTGNLSQINNSGTISATTSALNNHAQIAVAVDASASPLPMLFINTGTVVGDVKLGSNNGDQLAVNGANASLVGNISTTGNGRVGINISQGGVGGHLETASINTASVVVLNSGANVTFDIGQNATVINASGPATLDGNSHIDIKAISLVTVNNIALIHSDAGLTINGSLSTIASGVDIPFLYTGSLTADSKNLMLAITRKTAAQLGLTGVAATIYEPTMAAAINDPTLAAAFGTVPDEAHLQAVLGQFQPTDPGYFVSTAALLTDPNTGTIGARQRRLTFAPLDNGFAFWTNVDYNTLSFEGADGHSVGATLGVDFTTGKNQATKAHFGIAFSLEETRLNQDVNNAENRGTWYLVTPYLGFDFGNVFVNAQLEGGSATVTTRRTVIVGTENRTSGGNTSEPISSIGLVGGYIFNFGNWRVAPEASFSALQIMNAAYTESGGGAGVDLTVHTKDLTTANVFAGIALSTTYDVLGGHLVPQLLAGWNESVDSSGSKVTANYASVPSQSFDIIGPQTGHSGFLGSAIVDFGSDFTTISLGYDSVTGGKTQSQAGHLRLATRF